MHYHGCVYVTRKTYITYMRPCGIFCMHNRGLRVFSDSDELSAEACGLGFKQWGEKCEGVTGEERKDTPWVSQQRINLLLHRWWIPPMQQPHNYIHPFLPCQQEHWSLNAPGQAAENMQGGEFRWWLPDNCGNKYQINQWNAVRSTGPVTALMLCVVLNKVYVKGMFNMRSIVCTNVMLVHFLKMVSVPSNLICVERGLL